MSDRENKGTFDYEVFCEFIVKSFVHLAVVSITLPLVITAIIWSWRLLFRMVN